MLHKIPYALKSRGLNGSLKLVGSYGQWYWQKATRRDRKFLRQLSGYQMYLNLDDPGLSTTLGRGGSREKDQSKVLQQELKPGMTVLDIGANLGYYALMEASLVGPGGKIYAVEPVPSNYKFLVENIRLNNFTDRMESFQMAVSDHDGTQKLYLSRLSNLNTLFPDHAEGKQEMTGECLEVKTVDVVSFLKGKRPVDLIRMDIEGAEVEVFNSLVRGAGQLARFPKVLFETHRPKYTPQHSLEAPLQELFHHGYYVKRLISNSDNGSKWQGYGYRPDELIMTDGTVRGIYSGVSSHDALRLICREGGVRAALLDHHPGKR